MKIFYITNDILSNLNIKYENSDYIFFYNLNGFVKNYESPLGVITSKYSTQKSFKFKNPQQPHQYLQ